MTLSVIIPTYKRSADLPRIFQSLAEQVDKPEEILVVIGPCDLESLALATKFKVNLPSLRIIQATKASVIHSMNLGLSLAQNEIICLLDDDVYVPKRWALKIRKAFIADKKLGAFGGRDYLQNGSEKFINPPQSDKIGIFRWKGESGNHHRGALISPVIVDCLKGVNLSFRRSALNDLLIDTALESQGAETCWEIDLCQRIVIAGYHNVYDNDNYLLHYWSPRLGFDSRIDLYSPAWPRRIFNESYVMVKFRPWIEVIGWAGRLFILGSRMQPGVIWSILLLTRGKIKVLKLPWRNLKFIFLGGRNGLKKRNQINITRLEKKFTELNVKGIVKFKTK